MDLVATILTAIVAIAFFIRMAVEIKHWWPLFRPADKVLFSCFYLVILYWAIRIYWQTFLVLSPM